MVISSRVTGTVVSYPRWQLPAESPTSITGIPASSNTDAVIASYAVSMGHFSPRSLAAAMSRTVIRRVPLPPYSVVPPAEEPDVVPVWAAESCVIEPSPNTSSRGALTASPDHVHGGTSPRGGPEAPCGFRPTAPGTVHMHTCNISESSGQNSLDTERSRIVIVLALAA